MIYLQKGEAIAQKGQWLLNAYTILQDIQDKSYWIEYDL